jgi:hypothetical protein
MRDAVFFGVGVVMGVERFPLSSLSPWQRGSTWVSFVLI